MGEIIISTAKMEDAEELNRIECAAFPSAEAASLESYKYRITNINDWFLKAEEDGKIVGLICCRPVAIEGVTDDMYEPEPVADGKVICILSVAVSLACKDKLVHYYAKFGFVLNGISASEHGGVQWNDMILRF